MKYLIVIAALLATNALAQQQTPEQERKQLIDAYRAATMQRNQFENALIQTQVALEKASEANSAEVERLKKLCGELCKEPVKGDK